MDFDSTLFPLRPAWVEIDLARLRNNLRFIPEAKMWDEAVLMGRLGNEAITMHDIAKLKNPVSYDGLTNWQLRLRRISVNGLTPNKQALT